MKKNIFSKNKINILFKRRRSNINKYAKNNRKNKRSLSNYSYKIISNNNTQQKEDFYNLNNSNANFTSSISTLNLFQKNESFIKLSDTSQF